MSNKNLFLVTFTGLYKKECVGQLIFLVYQKEKKLLV